MAEAEELELATVGAMGEAEAKGVEIMEVTVEAMGEAEAIGAVATVVLPAAALEAAGTVELAAGATASLTGYSIGRNCVIT